MERTSCTYAYSLSITYSVYIHSSFTIICKLLTAPQHNLFSILVIGVRSIIHSRKCINHIVYGTIVKKKVKMQLGCWYNIVYGTSSFNGEADLGGVAGNCPAGFNFFTQACKNGTRALPNSI